MKRCNVGKQCIDDRIWLGQTTDHSPDDAEGAPPRSIARQSNAIDVSHGGQTSRKGVLQLTE